MNAQTVVTAFGIAVMILVTLACFGQGFGENNGLFAIAGAIMAVGLLYAALSSGQGH